MTDLVIRIDLQVDQWKVPEARAYRGAVGVNAEYAADSIQRAFADGEKEARAEFGDKVDIEGWEPPDGWTPPGLFNIDPDYLLGFAWIPARRDDPALEYDAFAESVPYGDLLKAFWESVLEAVKEAAPFENREARRKRGLVSKTGSKSAPSTTGRSPRSTTSASPSSAKPSASSTSPKEVSDGD